MQKLLEQAGATVILTRSDENGIYDLDKKSLRQKKVSDIKNRVKIGNEAEADIFVSIHLNKIPQSEYWGWQTFFKKGNEQSKKLAQSLQSGLNQTIDKENKRESLKIADIEFVNKQFNLNIESDDIADAIGIGWGYILKNSVIDTGEDMNWG